MATRDQWYKPNLLYNIHYRPPIKVEPPKMIIQTSLFNPSVCTCGEHGCEPKYRMERKVLWSEKEIVRVEREEKTREHQQNVVDQDIKDKERIRCGHVERGDASDGDRNKKINIGVIEWRNTRNGSSIRGDSEVDVVDNKINIDGAERRENNGGSIRDDSGVDVEDKKINTDGIVSRRNNDGCIRVDGGGIGIEKVLTDVVITKFSDECSTRSNDRSDVCNEKKNINVIRNYDKEVGRDSESCGSGIDDGKIYTDGVRSHCNNDAIVRGDGGFSSRNISIDDIESQRNNDEAIITNGYGSTGDTSVNQSEDVGTQEPDKEISSAFGIMSVYCNSEMHSWRMVTGEDSVE